MKSRLSNSTPRVVVNLVNKLLGTAPRSVVRVHTFMRSREKEDGGSPSASEAMRSSDTIWEVKHQLVIHLEGVQHTSDCPGLKLRV